MKGFDYVEGKNLPHPLPHCTYCNDVVRLKRFQTHCVNDNTYRVDGGKFLVHLIHG